MTSYSDKLLEAFRHAEKINATLWHCGIDPQYLSVDELRDHIAEAYGIEVNIYAVDLEVDHVYGLIQRYDDGKRANIYILKNIGPRWKRLVGTKELCHVVIDVPDEDFVADGWDTLQRLIAGSMLDKTAPENLALRSEHLAEIVAWELLYPHENRWADVRAIEKGELTLAELSKRLKLPEEVVGFIISPIWMTTCDRLWAVIQKQNDIRAAAKVAVGTR